MAAPTDGRFDAARREPHRRGATGPATGVARPRITANGASARSTRLDRDYDEYRREHQSKFESDFSNWRSTRQAKRQMLGAIREHMEVVGIDEQPVGTVDKVRGDRIILTKTDSPDGQHHSINCAMIDRVEGDRVILDRHADEAKATLGSEERDRALFERDDQRESRARTSSTAASRAPTKPEPPALGARQ